MALPAASSGQVGSLLTDDFDRGDGDNVGNGWIEREAPGATVGISGGRLAFFDTSDVALRPMVSHLFPRVSSGVLEWSFDFDWRRTGEERGYAVYAQLGDGERMRPDSIDAGVGVNLVWGVIGGADQTLGYRASGVVAPIGPLSGAATVRVRVDLDRSSYEVAINGVRVRAGVPLSSRVSVDTVRLFTDRLNEEKFAGRAFDRIRVVRVPSSSGNAPPSVTDRTIRIGNGAAHTITLTYSDSDGPGPYTFDIVERPRHGTLRSDDGDAVVTYVPNASFVGEDSFTYRTRDGLAVSNVGAVRLLVQHFPGAEWETRPLAQVGLDPTRLDRFVAAVGGVGAIVKDGYMVRTWGSQAAKADWASAAKPVVNMLLLFAVQEGLIPSLESRVEPWIAASTGGWLEDADRPMTFAHLTNGTSGYARAEPPGAAWAYNDVATQLRNRLLTAIYGEDLDASLRARLVPLGLQDGTLLASRDGYGVWTTTRDFARIGWLWLNRGNWNGSQLLAESLLAQYMRPQVPGSMPRSSAPAVDYLGVGSIGGGTDQTPYGPGIFGFNLWFNDFVATTSRRAWPDAPPDTFMALGHFNREVVVVIPSLNLVVASRGAWGSFEPGNARSGMNERLRLLAGAVVRPPGN